MNWQQFKHLFAKTRRPHESELQQAKDGILSCLNCSSLGIVVSDTPDYFAYGYCPNCKLADKLNVFSVNGLPDKHKHAGAVLPVECPDCGVGSQLIVRDGKYGLFVGCSNYPVCKFLQNVSTRVEN